MRWNIEEGEDIDVLGVRDSIAALTQAGFVYGNDAYHWTKTKAAQDSILRNGLGTPKKYFIEEHEVAAAYSELSAASRRRLLKKYGDPHTVVADGQFDVMSAFKKDNPTWSRVWVSGDPLKSTEGARTAAAYGPYGVRIRLEDWIDAEDPWGTSVDDYVYGMGLTFVGSIPAKYLEPASMLVYPEGA